MNFTKYKSQYVFLKLNFKFFLAFFEFIFKFAEFSKSINFLLYFLLHVCTSRCHDAPIKPENPLQEPILSFHHMGPGTAQLAAEGLYSLSHLATSINQTFKKLFHVTLKKKI